MPTALQTEVWSLQAKRSRCERCMPHSRSFQQQGAVVDVGIMDCGGKWVAVQDATSIMSPKAKTAVSGMTTVRFVRLRFRSYKEGTTQIFISDFTLRHALGRR